MSKMNVFQYAATCERKFELILEDIGTYRRKTTFYSDLSIAELYGAKSVIDTFRNVMKHWLNDITYITEFVLCLNHKSWEWHSNGDEAMTAMYIDLYEKAADKVLEHYKDNKEALDYYYEITD